MGTIPPLACPRSFAIVGDAGIDRVTPADFWDSLRNTLAERFTAGRYCEGLLQILDRVEAVLVEHFPYEAGDVDELPDEISFEPSRLRALPWLIIGGVVVVAALLLAVWRLFLSGWS